MHQPSRARVRTHAPSRGAAGRLMPRTLSAAPTHLAEGCVPARHRSCALMGGARRAAGRRKAPCAHFVVLALPSAHRCSFAARVRCALCQLVPKNSFGARSASVLSGSSFVGRYLSVVTSWTSWHRSAGSSSKSTTAGTLRVAPLTPVAMRSFVAPGTVFCGLPQGMCSAQWIRCSRASLRSSSVLSSAHLAAQRTAARSKLSSLPAPQTPRCPSYSGSRPRPKAQHSFAELSTCKTSRALVSETVN